MKLVFFIDIILFFAAEFTYEIFLFSVYYIFGCFTRILNQFSIKNSHKENVYHYNSHRH